MDDQLHDVNEESGLIVPEAEPIEPGWYVTLDALGALPADTLVYVLGVDGERVDVLHGKSRWSVERDAFASLLRPEPDGLSRRQAQVMELMREAGELQAQAVDPAAALRAFNPHVADDGGVGGGTLVPVGGSADDAKRAIATLRNQAARLRADLEQRQAQIQAFAEEQALILRHQAEQLSSLLKTAEEAVWTINLYLGTNEEIVTLADGAPAPADTPISIRQLVLYMDEECAIAAEEGGIDATQIDRFDEWLTEDPAHLAQVLPEPRGIVALKPRRQDKDYRTGNAFAESVLNQMNRQTYFLIRNGERLYRMWTDYRVGENLVPRTDEFLRLFVERRYNWQTKRDEAISLKPGSAGFMRAEKAADGLRRHYMRAALVLQGLIDRTPVFRPLAWPRIDVSDQAFYGTALQVVLDGDAMLSDGRERFTDWLRRINGELDLGQRVIGAFNNSEHGLRSYEIERGGGNERISPRHAGYPSSNRLYTIEGKERGELYFYFERAGERWDSWAGAQPYQKRARCTITTDDRFILNFDAATVDEMRYYLGSRLDRHTYAYMIPLLKLGLRLKAAEAAAEAPFARLAAGMIAQQYDIDLHVAEAAVPALVRWWKFKNRTHRALTDDDAKALAMIVAEYGHRAREAAEQARRGSEAERVVELVLAAHPDALLIAHKAAAEYVALVPANDDNIFVHEQVWTARGRKQVREWRTVDARHERWRSLHTSPRWADWKIGASRAEHLTDPEREALIAAGWTTLASKTEYGRPRKGDIRPLAAAVTSAGEIELFFFTPAPIARELLLTNHPRPRNIERGRVAWRRDASHQPTLTHISEASLAPSGLPWEREWSGRPYAGRVLWSDPAAIAELAEHNRQVTALGRRADELRRRAERAFSSIERQYLARFEAAAHARFLADYGDETLWPAQRKTLRLPEQLTEPDLRRALAALVERDIDVVGLSVGEIIARAAELGERRLSVSDTILELRVEADADRR